MKKTKYQQILEAPKGCMEYNPTQSFALHVYWIVRSPTAAKEMIEKGFIPCSKATLRDTPTTLGYFFRIARDQSLAAKFKEEIKTIGQHPHYQPSFKSMQMGIPRPSVEMKLRHGGIDLRPLDWNPDEPIAGHEKEIDFDPIVLECTEIYLDNRSFFEHSASHEWMGNSPEILKASRSLKPTTFCVGNPSTDIWEKALESYLKAIRFEDNKQVAELQPGVYFTTSNREGNHLFYLELDLAVPKDNLKDCHKTLALLQQELEALYMIILPANVHEGKEQEIVQVRVMLTFLYANGITSAALHTLAKQQAEGQLVFFNEDSEKDISEEARQFLTGLTDKISIIDGHKLEQSSHFAGYILHPLFRKITANENINYTV